MKVDRIKFMEWAWLQHYGCVVPHYDILSDLKHAGESILDVGSILTRIGYVPGYLCEPPVITEKVQASEVEFIYKDPFK